MTSKEKNPLAQIVDDIAVKKILAESNPRVRVSVNDEGEEVKEEITNPHVIRQLEAKKRQANSAIEDLFKSYRDEVMQSSIFTVVVGPEAEAFAKKAHKDCNTFSYGASDFYSSLVDQIPSKVYAGKVADQTLLEHIVARFEDRAFDIGIKGYKGLVFERKYAKQMKEKSDVVNLIKEIFHQHIGTEVIGLDAIHRASKDGVNDGFGGKVVPIVLHTTDIDLAAKLCGSLSRLSPYVISVKAGEVDEKELTTDLSVGKITKKSVVDTMLKIRKQVM